MQLRRWPPYNRRAVSLSRCNMKIWVYFSKCGFTSLKADELYELFFFRVCRVGRLNSDRAFTSQPNDVFAFVSVMRIFLFHLNFKFLVLSH